MRQFLKQIYIYASIVLLLLLASSCDHETNTGTPMLDEREGVDYELYDRYVDKHGNKGLVAYVSKNEYIIVISSDEAYLPWGKMGQTITPSFNAIGSSANMARYGIAMLLAMASDGIDDYPAQKWCNDKNHGDEPYAGSWHLPSAVELDTFTKGGRLEALSAKLELFYGRPLSDEKLYWTCVEDLKGVAGVYPDYVVGQEYDSDNRARCQFLPNSVHKSKDSWYKKERRYVRAIKFIYYNKW